MTERSDRKAVRCPECGSQKISKLDDEGLIDCYACGIWFDPQHPNNRACFELDAPLSETVPGDPGKREQKQR